MDSPSTANRRRRRGSLDQERILAAAFGLAEESGLDAFTMPELAGRMGVGVTGLYWHFKTKDDLLRAMSGPALQRLDALMLSVEGEDPAQWRDFMGRYFRRLRDVYTDQPLLTDITLTRLAPQSHEAMATAFASVDRLIAYLVSAGFTVADAWYAHAAAELFTQGTVIAERTRTRYGMPPPGHEHIREFTDVDLPNLTELVRTESVHLDMTGGRGFDVGLDAILSGIETTLNP
ncbi:TetR/AcrR family transcriptional regulator [Rhodococcus sp. NPDC058481]|uniref:TetR/AcrR family transcriptional regulator n=1 Tax=unclassified Rhodococcus (in: high G+C Gram-positive bacteria) TaxID=192944 RepID=UPI0036521859